MCEGTLKSSSPFNRIHSTADLARMPGVIPEQGDQTISLRGKDRIHVRTAQNIKKKVRACAEDLFRLANPNPEPTAAV